ncbi:IPT/TIG domain-containing protein [Tieghemostelium lacteum]|uniref:IPT/TIG domain-containing protein n=1 Tax=Tieghemostelium lacteum TaxID=361077 RepID=A0A152A2L0_TIELA|nr:IPT/TIG domain-containing protein [Tieghemostelium lacteum]|eukprot:KYR00492.1 IPT/TIG domain-containing protein [Tieghemostelium lacteum]
MKNNYSFVLLLILLVLFNSLSIVYSQTYTNYVKWTTNNHWYVRVNETDLVSIESATAKCALLEQNGNIGYLATITSLEEWQFLMNNSLTSMAAWISGSDYAKLGSWVYSTGPETGMPLYNLYFDKCYQFCVFGPIEPNLLPNEHWLHTSGSGTNQYWNNNNNNAASLKAYICEFGGLNDPIIDTTPTVGGQISIKNIIGYDLPSLTITWTSKSDGSTFTCSNRVIVDSTTIQCQVPPNTGKYNVKFLDKNAKTVTLNWAFITPYISSVYPGYNVGDVITVTGSGFGTVASKITVSVGASMVACNTPAVLRPDEAVTCTLSATLAEKFLPITINVNGQGYSSYKVAFYNRATSLFYSGFVSASGFDLTRTGYANALKLDGYTGTMAYIKDAAFYDFIFKTLPVPFGSGLWNIWQPYYYDGTKYIFNDGPNIGSTVVPYSKTAIDLNGVTTATRFWLNLTTGGVEQQVATVGGSTLAQYGGISPKFTNIATHTITTSGGKAYLQIDNYGTVFSSIQVKYFYRTTTTPLSLTFTRDYINSLLIADIPAGYSGPYSISVTVDTFTTSNAQYIDYESPTITSIPPISTSGGSIVITGTNYFNTLSLVSVQGLTCSNLAIQTAHTVLTCTIPSGSGKTSTTVTVGDKVSSPFTFQYSNPTVSSVSNISPLGGIITINGGNFFTDSSKISISLGTFGSCTGVKVETAHSVLSCTAPAGYAKQPVIVTVNTLVSNSDIYLNYISPTITSVTQVDDYLNIIGNNFGNSLNGLTITLGSIDITSNCLSGSTNTAFSCKNLPTTVQSGTLSISGSNSVPTQTVNLVPYLSSLGQTSIPTSGSTVSINGRFFESNIIVKIGTTTSTFTKTNNQLLMLTIPSGTGTGKIVTVSNNNGALQSVGSLTFSYTTPTITTAVQTLNSLLISGQNFGNDLSKISVNIGTTSIPSNQITLTTSHTQITITLADNLQNAALTVTVDSQPATLNTFKLKPILTRSTKPSVDGGYLTISGNFLSQTNQAGQSTNVQFKLNNVAVVCTFINGSSPYYYECTSNSGFGQISAVATVDGVSSDPFTLSFTSPTLSLVKQVNDYIEISGTEFGVDFNSLTVLIGSVDITSGCTGNSTFGKCINLPTSVQSGEVSLTGAETVPTYDIDFVPYLVSLGQQSIQTSGSVVAINGRFFENNIVVKIGPTSTTFTKTNNQQLQLNVPAGTGTGKIVTVSNNNGALQSVGSLTFSYTTPSITNTVQTASSLLINGQNFGNDLSKISVNIGTTSLPSNQVSLTTDHTQITITLDDNLQNAALTVTVDTQDGTLSSFKLKPILTSGTSPSVDGGKFVISGNFLSQTNQAGQSTNVQFKFNNIGSTCTFLSGPSPYKYECTIGSGFGQINSIATVDGVDSDSFRFYYASPIITSVQQVDDFIELFGNEFGIDFNGLTVSIGPISLSGCTSNNTFGQCKNLPLTVQSGNVTLSGENTDPEPIELIFKPFLKTINPTIVDTKGQEITITGRFFEQSTLGSPNSLSILDSGISQSILTLVSNSEVLYTTQPNTGKDHNTQLQISNRTSNILKFDNEKPIINSIFQDQDTLVINGEYFGTSNQVVSTSINKTPISIQDDKVVIPLSPSDMNNNLTVTVSDQESNSNSFYLTPLIESSSSVGVEGGILTLSGKYLSDIDANSNPIGLVYTFTKINIIMTTQDVLNTTITCQYKSNIEKTICSIPPVTGEFEIYSQYLTYKSNIFRSSVIAPGIQLATPTKKGTPGKVTITGSNFGSTGLFVTIKNSTAFSECTNAVSLSSTKITCTFASDINTEISNGFTQPLTVNVTVDGKIGYGDVFNYQLIKECQSNCVSPFGSCIDGTCICSNEYTGTDCQTKKDDLPEQPGEKPTDNNGTTNVPGNNFQFQIAVTHLRELNSIDGSTVKTLKTSDLVWGQPVVNGDKKYYKGTFTSDPAIVELFVTYFKTSQTIQFAGETMQMADNSIKYEIHVSKWNFTKSINSLQVIYQSTTPKSVEYECETKETTTTFDTSSDSLGWFQVSNGGTTMMAKFSNKMLVDNRILNSQVKLLDQNDELYKENTNNSALELFVSMNTPTFRDKIILDPNFSSLLETTEEIKTECSSSKKWKIPLIAVLCSVGGVALIIAGIYGYKKYRASKFDIKLKTLRSIN